MESTGSVSNTETHLEGRQTPVGISRFARNFNGIQGSLGTSTSGSKPGRRPLNSPASLTHGYAPVYQSGHNESAQISRSSSPQARQGQPLDSPGHGHGPSAPWPDSRELRPQSVFPFP